MSISFRAVCDGCGDHLEDDDFVACRDCYLTGPDGRPWHALERFAGGIGYGLSGYDRQLIREIVRHLKTGEKFVNPRLR